MRVQLEHGPLYRVTLTNPETLLYCGASWEHVRREIRDYRVLREAGLMQDRELIVDDHAGNHVTY